MNFEGLDLKPILNNIKIPHGGHVEQCKGRELKKKKLYCTKVYVIKNKFKKLNFIIEFGNKTIVTLFIDSLT